MTTKERIVEEALRLFSQKGFYAVSVRDISREVGIKESSLYNHFKNKQDIFDTIVAICYQKAEAYFKKQSIPFDFSDDISMYQHTDFERLSKIVLATFEYFFNDEYNVMFRQLLTITQYQDEKAKQIYHQLYRDYPLQLQSKVFASLMETGEFKKADPKVIATDFYGAVFMLIHTCGSFDEAKPQILSHLKHFIENHQREDFLT